MKKEKKKEIRGYFSCLTVSGMLLFACSFLDAEAWEYAVGLISMGVGGFGLAAFDPSDDEPWHVKIDK